MAKKLQQKQLTEIENNTVNELRKNKEMLLTEYKNLVKKHDETYKHIDITQPMSNEEKNSLNHNNMIFSKINEITRQINSIIFSK